MEVKRKRPNQYLLRLPDGLRERIDASARMNDRTTATEIVRVLEEAFPEPVVDEMAVLRAENARLQASFEQSSNLDPAIAALIEKHIQAEVEKRLANTTRGK